MTDRLTRSDWIQHGFRTLMRHGPSALKAGPLATSLKVSRGSFYWHFASIADFHAALLADWQAASTDHVITKLETGAGPDRLRLLLRRAFFGTDKLGRAMRAWALTDRKVAAAVAAADRKRIAYIEAQLVAAGVDRKPAGARAQFLYWAYLGQMMDTAPSSLTHSALDDISRLFEA